MKVEPIVTSMALSINKAEVRATNSVEASSRFVLQLIEARREKGKPAKYGAAAISAAASAAHHFAQGLEKLATCHSELITYGRDEGLMVMFGDEGPTEALAEVLLKGANADTVALV